MPPKRKNGDSQGAKPGKKAKRAGKKPAYSDESDDDSLDDQASTSHQEDAPVAEDTSSTPVLEGDKLTGQVLISGSTNWDLTGRKQAPKGAKPSSSGRNLWGPHRLAGLEDISIRTVVSGCLACHSVHISTEGKVYVLGRNENGQLGLGDLVRRDPVTLVSSLSAHNVVAAACGRAHTLFLTDRGRVFGSGLNASGQLGVGNQTQTISNPTPLQYGGPPIKLVRCGGDFSAVVDMTGNAYTFGSQEYGQLGHNTDGKFFAGTKLVHSCETRPRRLMVFIDKLKDNVVNPVTDVEVVDIACGQNHMSIFAFNQQAWPRLLIKCKNALKLNKYKNLPTNSLNVRRLMVFIDKLKDNVVNPVTDVEVMDIACGQNHMVLMDKKERLFTWGFGGHGQLGHGENKDELVPRLLKFFDGPNRGGVKLGAGSTFCLAVNKAGVLYFWGKNKNTGDSTMYPKPVNDLAGWKINLIGCCNKSIIIQADQSVVSWGTHPTYGELAYGEGGVKSSSVAEEAKPFKGLHVNQIACGYGHSMFLVQDESEDEKTKISQMPEFKP